MLLTVLVITYRKNLTMDDVHDIHGLRLVVDTEEDCYRALDIVHKLWPRVTGRFKDYISHPKLNGYASEKPDSLLKNSTEIVANLLFAGIGRCTLSSCVRVSIHLKSRSEQRKCIYRLNMDLLRTGGTKKVAAGTPLCSKWWNGQGGCSHGNARQ